MNSKTILLLLLCCLGVFVKAQGFNKRYIDVRPAMQYSGVLVTDSFYYTIGVSTKMTSPYPAKPLWSQLTLNGLLEEYRVLEDSDDMPYGTFFNNLIKENDSAVKVFGYIDDTVSLYPKIWTIRFDGSIKRVTVFPDSTSNFVRGDYMIKDNSNNYYLGCNYQDANDNVDCSIIKINAQDSVLWKRKYGATIPWWEVPTSLSLLRNGNVIIGSWKFDQNLPIMKSYTWIFEIDSNGNVVRQWFDHDSTMEAKALKQTTDGGFIYASKRIGEQTINDVYCYTTIVKIDSMFSKQWIFQDSFVMGSDAGAFDIEELPDSGFIVCGNGNYINPNYNLLSGWIMKLRKDGSVVWSNGYTAYDTSDVENHLNDIDVLPDGNFIAVGYANIPALSPQIQQGWVLKIDSNGCEIENCLTGISQSAITNPQFVIFPNPAHDNFSLDIENPLLQGGSLDLYNIDGKKLSSTANNFTRQTKVDISQLPNCIYLWRYTAPNQTVESGKVIKE